MIQLCRGDRGGPSCRGGVGNGGLWSPKEVLEVARFVLYSSLLLLCPSSPELVASVGDEGYWPRLVDVLWLDCGEGRTAGDEEKREGC